MAEPDSATRGSRRELRIGVTALAVVLALFAAGLAYVKDVDLSLSPFGGDDPTYCWGAWGDENVPWPSDVDPDDLKVVKDAPPTAENRTGTCDFLFGRDGEVERAERGYTSVDTGGAQDTRTPQYTGRVTVTYDRFPEKEGDRLPWLTKYFDGKAAPLPDGLPGFVSEERGMMVLPPRCDKDYEPTVVTLTTKSRPVAHEHVPGEQRPSRRHSRSELSRLLLSAAQKGIEHAGCMEPDRTDDADDSGEHKERPSDGLDFSYDDRRYSGEDGHDPDKPDPDGQGHDGHAFRTDGPVLGGRSDPDSAEGTRDALCHLSGTRKTKAVLGSPGDRYQWSAGFGVPGAPSHLCSYRADFAEPDVATDEDGLDRQRTDGLSLTATSDERLVKLLLAATQRDDNEELPGWEISTYGSKDLAVARARCPAGASDPKDTLFVVLRSHPTKLTPAQVLPDYVTAVEKHLDCAGLAPHD